MSWTADGSQVVALCDGYGWPGTRRRFYYSRLYKLVGAPRNARFNEILGYPELVDDWDAPALARARYYGFGNLAVDGRIYQYLSTFNKRMDANSESYSDDLRFTGAKLIYSPDGGSTWCNQDGSTPVRWESHEDRSRENMIFFEEIQDAFSLLTVLQMGQDYRANTDDYAYVYAPNGNAEGTMNQLVMFRVPKHRILDRSAYEYFTRLRPHGHAAWTKKHRRPRHRAHFPPRLGQHQGPPLRLAPLNRHLQSATRA